MADEAGRGLMDPFLLTVWVVRLLFLALLYLFLFRSRGRSSATCGRPPASPAPSSGRLVVVASPAGEPPEGTSFPLDAIATLGRDVNNTIVVDDPFVSAEHAILTFRGRAWYVEDLGSTNGTFVNGAPGRGRGAARLRRRGPGRAGPAAPRAARAHEAVGELAWRVTATRAPGLPSILGPIRPRPRWREARLLRRRGDARPRQRLARA